MKKQELLAVLRESLKIEEDAIPLYSKNISSTIFLSGLKETKVVEIRNILKKLRDDSIDHKEDFIKLINELEKEK